MDIFLDDDLEMRKTPAGFMRFADGGSLLRFMQEGQYRQEINVISFDNDLGIEPEGYWTLKQLVINSARVVHWNIHSANTVAVNNMVLYLANAMRVGIISNAPVTTMSSAELNDYIDRK